MKITLKIEQQSPDGITLYAGRVGVDGYDPMGGVMGRGTTEAQAVSDWKRRALDDGHDVASA